MKYEMDVSGGGLFMAGFSFLLFFSVYDIIDNMKPFPCF